MRIVYLSPSGKLGGAEKVLLDVLTNLRESHPDWKLKLIVATPGPLAERASSLGVETSVLPFPPRLVALGDAAGFGSLTARLRIVAKLCVVGFDVARHVRALRAQIAMFAPDVIHSNGFKTHVLAGWARPPRTPVIWHIHDYIRQRFVSSRLLRSQAGKCSAAIVISTSVAEDAASVLGPRAAIYVVPNGVDLDHYSPHGPPLSLHRLAGLPPTPPGTLKVGLIASFARWKGHDVFLRALAELPASVAVRGYVVGGPLYDTAGSECTMEELAATVDRLRLRGRVGFVGFVDDAAAAMRGLDVVVHASTHAEPFGLVIIESMATGRPVIASLAGGVREIVTAEETALVHAPGDWQGLRDCIVRLADDASLRERLAKAGRAAVERQFDRRRVAAALVPIYRSLKPSAA